MVSRRAPKVHGRYIHPYLAIATYGKDWKKVEELVGTRSGSQVRSHAQKFFNKLRKGEGQMKTASNHHKAEDESEEHDGEESSFMKLVHEDNSNNTPIEIVSLIRG